MDKNVCVRHKYSLNDIRKIYNPGFISKFDLFIALIFMGLKPHAIGLNVGEEKTNSLGIHSGGDEWWD
jgi:hypothetical protein